MDQLMAAFVQVQAFCGGIGALFHARSRAWLELGPSRSLATYAAVLGVSKQSLNETAARFNWRQRAAAWDAVEEWQDLPLRSRAWAS
jgi:hypothetical protein